MNKHMAPFDPQRPFAPARWDRTPISRRKMLARVATAIASVGGAELAAGTVAGPLRDMPEGACDTHVHVIGDPHQYPMASDRLYTPATATADALGVMLRAHHLDRCVIVAAAVYGASNAATLDAVHQLGPHRARGVAWLPRDRSDATLRKLREAGIAGVRVLPGEATPANRAALSGLFETHISIAARWGWHLDIAAPPETIGLCRAQLAASSVPLVLDTFGWIRGGLSQRGADAILSLVAAGTTYVKLSEPYRLFERQRVASEMKPIVGALLAANPDRVLWGSGWPYVAGPMPGRPVTEITPNLAVDASDFLGLLETWVPDKTLRQKILVDNPARLYGFGVT